MKDKIDKAWWNHVSSAYAQNSDLFHAERVILDRFRYRWPHFDMLDLGIGGGRTTIHFAPLCRTYVGIDYSPKMVECARHQIQENSHIKLGVADARDLSQFDEATFDFVFFSYNGIDYIHPTERAKVLSSAKRVLKSDGVFLFSSHSLTALPLKMRPMPSIEFKHPIRTGYKIVKRGYFNIRIRRLNSKLDYALVDQRGWAVTPDGGENFTLPVAYVSTSFQARQIEDHGFKRIEVFDENVSPVDSTHPPCSDWVYYLCYC